MPSNPAGHLLQRLIEIGRRNTLRGDVRFGVSPEWQEISRSAAKPPFATRTEQRRLPTQTRSSVTT